MNYPLVFHSTLSTCSQDLSFSSPPFLCHDPAGTQFLVSWIGRQPELVELKRYTPFTFFSTPADLHFCMFLPQLVRVSCVFCVEFFIGLFCRPLGTRVGLLHLPPTLNVLSASVCTKTVANFQKNLPFTIRIVHVLFRVQPLHLHKCHLSHLNHYMYHE